MREATMKISKLKFATLGVLSAAAMMTTAIGYAQQHAKRSSEVQRDLETAMKGEAFAYAKYMLYAEQARAHGHADVAALLESTAKTERLEHFREHAELAGVISKSDADNLRDAIAGETYETTKMYPEMAARATRAGDKRAASRFAEIGKDESKHRDAFAAALARLEGAADKRRSSQ
jgi:rubrerythrin